MLTNTANNQISAQNQVGKSERSRWISLVILCTGFLMIVLDQTIVNVALPSIQKDLGFSQSSLAWVVNAYLIAFGGLLLLSGRLGDLVGRKRVFMIGLVIFTSASVLCGFAQNEAWLIIARFIQGAGGAVTSAVILGMIVTTFPESKDQTKAFSIYSFVATAGASVGLLAGGVLTQLLNWHWIFFVNIPIGIVTGILAAKLLDRDEGIGFAQGADLLGALLVVSSLMLGVYTIVEVPNYGWASSHTLGLGGIAALLLAAFVFRQSRIANPLMPLRIFRSRNVSSANIIQVLIVAGFFGMFFLGALYMQGVLGYDATKVGLAFMPVCLIMGTFSLGLGARLVMRFGPKATLIPGLGSITLGLALFSRLPVNGHYLTDILASMILLGAGAGLMFTALMTIAMSGATPSDAGLASGLVNTTAQVGGALGLALLATFSTTKTEALLNSGEATNSALVSGYHLAFTVGTVLAAVATLLAVVLLRSEDAEMGEVVPMTSNNEAELIEADA